jgi:hypothetical protein
MKKREEHEEMLRVKQMELKQIRDQEEKKKKQNERKEQANKLRMENQKKENEAKKKEEEQEQNKLDGRFGILLQGLQMGDTPFVFSVSGLNLGPIQCRLLASNLAHNSTLLTLHLARKEIKDNEGMDLAKMLFTNKTLRKLELESNNLGPLCAYAFGRALRVNKSLMYLDLESNQLTNDNTTNGGVTELFNFLPHNSTLISLNLANN